MTDETRTTLIKVAKVLNQYTVVINKGTKEGIKAGQRFLIYAYGDEVVDPDTKLSLGKLEIVRGTGRVIHLQESMATIKSDITSSPSPNFRTIRRKNPWLTLSQMTEEVEEKVPAEAMPFEGPEIGDTAKPV